MHWGWEEANREYSQQKINTFCTEQLSVLSQHLPIEKACMGDMAFTE